MEKKLIRRYYKYLFMLVIVFVGVSAGKVTTHAAINNTIGNAQYINTDGTTYSSNISDTTNARFYKFTLNESGAVTLNLKAYILFTDIYVYDSDGKEIVASQFNRANSVTQMFSTIENYDLTKGTYYFCISGYNGTFNFSMKFKSAQESFGEINGGNNNLMPQANSISLKKKYKGQIAINDDRDFYKFSINTNSRIRIDINARMYFTDIYIYDKNGQEMLSSVFNRQDENLKLYNDTYFIDLKKGTYYFCVAGYTGNYDFTLNTSVMSIKLNKSEISIDKNKTYALKSTVKPITNEKIKWTSDCSDVATVDSKGVVKAKKVGRAVIRAVVGNNVSSQCVVYVKPGASRITKLKAGRKAGNYRYLNVKYKSVKDASGYKIYYTTSSKGKYKLLYTTTSTSVDFYLKRKKKYYFKIRAYTYRYIWDKDIYSNYSGVKRIKL